MISGEKATQENLTELLPFLLKPENIARYEDGCVYICDRRKYPFSREFVCCTSVEEVAVAIEQMVTQGGGPWMAAAHAMMLAANEVTGQSQHEVRVHLCAARDRLVRTRPTNTAMARRLELLLGSAVQALESGGSVESTIAEWIENAITSLYENYAIRARYAASLIEDGDGILTNCFAETGFIVAVAMAVRDGKQVQVYAPETRPYFQGAKLTSPCLHELGIRVKLITDNMPAFVMSEGLIQKYFTAADLITVDGHVINKIGTFQLALAAQYHNIPFYAFAWGKDENSKTRSDIKMEYRDAAEIRQAMGQPTTVDSIDAWYPAFDICPPQLVAGVVTVHGVLEPGELVNYSRW
jgi:methylthioribose-1-phosphate isomerase